MKKVKRTFCPKCKGVNTLMFYAGATTGTYKCKKCKYLGQIILEERLDVDDRYFVTKQ